ncbi:MAG: saccharopine dehydrogenase NADP-binding domain-containing protein [Labilithrix sp.]|nr:saccharopine dehydrogenase NADP-binding domain-containing protein [Labilithrix sp.]MCW5817348.1 saccharopine dehydrogenase NADP-binding domain-containing protein [Labilithrix sp.]
MNPIVVYGANGRTGRRVAETLLRRGLPIVAGGRDPVAIAAVSQALGVDARVAPVTDAGRLVAGVSAVVNCAGPFVETARSLAEACVEARAHYLDLSTEPTAIRSLIPMHGPARRANVKIVPAAGATGALGAWARRLANEYALTPLHDLDVSYAHGGASFLRPTPGALQSFAKEVLHLLEPEKGGYRLVPRRVLFPPPFGLGHAIQTRGPDDVALPEALYPAQVRSWLSVDPGTAFNGVWTAFHEPSLSRGAAPAIAAIWRAAATADMRALARLLPTAEEAAFAIVLESQGPRVAISAASGHEAAARSVEQCLQCLDADCAGVLSVDVLVPARTALRSLSRNGVIRVFRDDRSPRYR